MRLFSLTALSLLAMAAFLPFESRPFLAAQESNNTDNQAAIERARKTVHMLDDIYKTAIVMVTDKYVHNKKDYPAGRLAVNWFKSISKNGSHEIRIIDATGQPHNDDNVAKDEFEKEGIQQMKHGKPYFEKVESEGGKSYLRAMTAVPVVLQQCILCHENYKSAKKGEAIGALTYKFPID